MGMISVNPEKLNELSEYYSNKFDTTYRDVTERFGTTIGKLSTTWEGEEATTANAAYEKIKASLQRIEERSNDIKRIVAGKATGFQETVDNTKRSFNQMDDVKF
jgi:uncharacterized protein YukE